MIGSMTGALTPITQQRISISARRAGHVLSGVAVLFLALDTAMKLLGAGVAVEGTMQLGYPVSVIVPLGIIEALCLVLYLMPGTSVLGAVLWTGYLGGAVATHVRIGHPLFSHVLFPTYVAALLWGGLWLRDTRLRLLLPLRAK
jgi:DoxX-like protein